MYYAVFSFNFDCISVFLWLFAFLRSIWGLGPSRALVLTLTTEGVEAKRKKRKKLVGFLDFGEPTKKLAKCLEDLGKNEQDVPEEAPAAVLAKPSEKTTRALVRLRVSSVSGFGSVVLAS